MSEVKPNSNRRLGFSLISLLLLSILIKVTVASFGHGFDVGAWREISRIVRESGHVYGKYEFYNYGPIWAWVLAPIGYFSEWLPLSRSEENFHMWVALFLSLVDGAMALLLQRAGYPRAAFAFLLNPVTWLVSGFVAQFDQLPVFVGLLAVFSLSRARLGGARSWAYFAGFIVLLGISLMTKHFLIFFPAWAAFWWLGRCSHEYGRALALACFPLGIFLLSFLPFWPDPAARAGILQNVVRYESNYHHSLLPQLLGLIGLLRSIEDWFSWVPFMPGYRFVWLVGMLSIGWFSRGKSALDLYLIYLVSIVAFSPSIYGQYLVIPILACAFWGRYWEAWAYTAAATAYLTYYSVRKMPFFREAPFFQESGLIAFLDNHYESMPKYFPLVFLLPLLWRLVRADVRGIEPGCLKEGAVV